MRQFTAGDNSDSTAAVVAYLAGKRQLYLADLYLLGEFDDPNAVRFTNWSSPLSWPVWGTFNPTVVSRSKVTSEVLVNNDPQSAGIGGSSFKVSDLEVTWSPPLTSFSADIATANPYQKARYGFYDNWKARVWRTVMPTPGDANTLGATPWFGGWINNTEIGRGYIKFSIQSFLNVVNQKVPPNVIESSNAFASYVGAVPVIPDAETSIPTFNVVAPSSTNLILGQCTGPTANKIYANNRFRLGYLYFTSGTLKGFWSPIAANTNYNAGGGIHYNEFQTYAQFPWAPTPGDTFYASIQPAVDLAGAQSNGEIFQGFPYVPSPLAAI